MFEQLPSGKCATCTKQIIQVDGEWKHANVEHERKVKHKAIPAKKYKNHLEIRTDVPNRNEQVW